MWIKIIQNVVKSQKFPSPYRKSTSLRTTVITDFGPEAQIMPILRMRKEKMAQTGRKRFPIAEISVSYRKSRSLNPTALSVAEAQK